jgi:GAF domain-containing protein
VLADSEYNYAEALKLASFRTMLGIPLLREGTPIGVIALTRDTVQPFTDRQIELVSTFADQAVIAIENARLFDEVQARTRELSESLEQQTATSECYSYLDARELEVMFANATRICEATFGNLFLREGPTLRAVAVHGKKIYADSWQRDAVIDLRDNRGVPLDRLANTKQVTHVADLQTEPSYINKNFRMTNLVDVAGARTLAVPMLKDGELVGAVDLYRRKCSRSRKNRVIAELRCKPCRHRERGCSVELRIAPAAPPLPAFSRLSAVRRENWSLCSNDAHWRTTAL